MRVRPVVRFACAIAIAGLFAPGVCAAEWLELRTPNFLFIGDAPEHEIRDTARKLEQFREVLTRITPALAATSPVPTVVVLFQNEQAFAPYQPVLDGKRLSEVSGYFQSGDTVNYVAMNAGVGPEAVRVIFHEYTHFLTTNSLGGTPAWFGEGLAQLYETTEIQAEGASAIVGAPLVQHLLLLRQAPMLSLDRLMTVTESLSVLHGSHAPNVFYSQSWALMHYLMLGNPARSGQLHEYTSRLQRGETAEAAFGAFGVDARAIEQELVAYVHQPQFSARRFTFTDKVTGGDIPRARPMPDGDAEAYLADLLARMGRGDEGRRRLRQLLESNSANARAAAVLGWLEFGDGRLDDALRLLERSASLLPEDASIQSAFGRVLYEQARRSPAERSAVAPALARARTVLARAVTLDPRAAPTLVALAHVETGIGSDLARATELIAQAVALAPSRLEYRLALAEALLREGRTDAAIEQLKTLAARANVPEISGDAAAMLARLGGASDDPSTAAALPGARRPALRAVLEGERQVVGRFVRMDCSGPVTQFHVETEAGVLRLDGVLGGVSIIAHAPAPSSFGCGAVVGAPRVLATYRPPAPDAQDRAAGGAYDGIVVAIEIVPGGFIP